MTHQPAIAANHPSAAPDDSTTGKHLPALDGVRGLALGLVLLRHLFVRNPFAGGSGPVMVVTRLFATGWVGVDLFFVLSGFLITGILYDTLHTPHFFRNFYARRALRIFPLYYGVIFTLVIVSLSMGHHWFLPGSLGLLTYTGTLHLQPTGPTDTAWINLTHMWSLQIEEQFYLVWPLTVFLLRSRRRIALVAFAGVTASLLLRCAMVGFGLWSRYLYCLYSWTPSRLDGLLLGAALAMLVRSSWRQRTLSAASPVFFAGAAVCLVSIFLIHLYAPEMNATVGIIAPLLYGVTFAALLAAALPVNGLPARLLSFAWLRFLGRLSYGIYVFHWLIHGMVDDRMHDWFAAHSASKLLGTVGPGMAELLLSVMVAWLSFHFFELPILGFKRFFAAERTQPRLRASAEMGSGFVPGSTQ